MTVWIVVAFVAVLANIGWACGGCAGAAGAGMHVVGCSCSRWR